MEELTEERLRGLLKQGHEHEALDYKGQFNHEEKRAWVELAKDVGAMQIVGGHIVFGADDSGRLTGMLSEQGANLLDESVVRNKLRAYLDESFDIRTAIHIIDGHRVGLLYVAPHPDGFCIFSADGNYEEKGKTKQAFRKGDVCARHGSSSEPWHQRDIDRIRRILKRRSDAADREHINSIAVPLTYALAAEPDFMLHLVGFDGTSQVTEAVVAKLCASLKSTDPAPQVGPEQYANWWGFFQAWKRRSRETIERLLALSPFLEAEHVVLVTKLGRSELFTLLDDGWPPAGKDGDLAWIAKSVWDYYKKAELVGGYLVRLTSANQQAR